MISVDLKWSSVPHSLGTYGHDRCKHGVMIDPQSLRVICDSCGGSALYAGIDGGLGELVRGLREEGWSLASVDQCPSCAIAVEGLNPAPISTCDVLWCQVNELGHTWHQGAHRFVHGDVAGGMDEPEHEGMILHVAIEGATDRPRLGVAITGWDRSPTIRLNEEATNFVRAILTGAEPPPVG